MEHTATPFKSNFDRVLEVVRFLLWVVVLAYAFAEVALLAITGD